MPLGELNQAALPTPSRLPRLTAEPARVVTTPSGVILRLVALPVSATYTFPATSTARPPGWLNRAFVPVPSWVPTAPVDPANVLTMPAGVIFRMVLSDESATKRLPALSAAMPTGYWRSPAPLTVSATASLVTEPAELLVTQRN